MTSFQVPVWTEVVSRNRDCRPHRSLTFYEHKEEKFSHSDSQSLPIPGEVPRQSLQKLDDVGFVLFGQL